MKGKNKMQRKKHAINFANKYSVLLTKKLGIDIKYAPFVFVLFILFASVVIGQGVTIVTGNLNMNNNRITNLATPVASNDAATKGYVDTQSGSGPWIDNGTDVYLTNPDRNVNISNKIFIKNTGWEMNNLISNISQISSSSLAAKALDENTVFVVFRSSSNLMFAKTTDGGTRWWISEVDTSGNIGDYNSIEVINANTIYVSYYDSVLKNLMFAKTTDQGKTWTKTVVDYEGDAGTYNSISAINSTHIYISYLAGNKLKFAKSSDAGATWSDYTVLYSGVSDKISIYALDSNNIFISYHNVSEDMSLAKTTDGGATWTFSSVETAGNVGYSSKVMALNSTHVYVVYYDGTNTRTRFANSTNGGASWTLRTVNTSTVMYYHSMHVVNSTTMLVGYVKSSPCLSIVAKTTDGGASWASYTAHYSCSQNTMSAVNISTIYTFNLGSGQEFSKTTDSGVSWTNGTAFPSGGTPNNDIAASAADESSVYIAYTYSSTGPNVVFSRPMDSNLKKFEKTFIGKGQTSNSDISMYAVPNGPIFLVYKNASNLVLAKSINNGTTWSFSSISSDISTGRIGIYALNASHIYLSYINSTNGKLRFAKSTNSGDTWTISDVITSFSAGSTNPSSIHALNSTHIYIGYYRFDFISPTVYVYVANSTNGGASWTESSAYSYSTESFQPVNYISIKALDPTRIYLSYCIYTYYSGPPDSYSSGLNFAKYLNGTWYSTTLDSYSSNFDVDICSTGDMYVENSKIVHIASRNATIWRTTDSGESWVRSPQFSAGSTYPLLLGFPGDKIYLVFSLSIDKYIIKKNKDLYLGVGTNEPNYMLDVSGTARASGFLTSSDIRLKTNIEPITGVLDKIMQIRGVTFDWNNIYQSMGRSTGQREIGVIAQEVEQVYPELVSKWGDQDYRAVDYGRLTAVLIEAIKELKKENDDLKRRVDALEYAGAMADKT